jgi:hypothetical protein
VPDHVASPLAVVDAARELAAQGVLQSNLLISLQRVAEGLLLGVAADTAAEGRRLPGAAATALAASAPRLGRVMAAGA